MRFDGVPAMVRGIAALAVLAGMVSIPRTANGHENHAPLPTKGVTTAGDTIMLSDKAREAIGLTTAKIEFGDIRRTVESNARVELPWHGQAMITSLVAGKIEQVLVRPGETVAPGQELARVVSPDLESLQLAMLRAQAEVDLARRLVDQRTALDQQGIVAGKSLLETQASLAEKSASLQIARQKLLALGLDSAAIEKLRQTGQTLRYVSITSPRGGVITHADVRVGQIVSPTDHLYHVVDPSRLWIVGDVLESDVHYLKKGQQVAAGFAALPGKRFAGVIDHLRPKMDPKTRTQPVVVAVDNPAGDLRPGMFGHVHISVEVAKEAILCPADAVIRSRTGTYLLVQRMPGKYENRPVKLGLNENGRVELLQGAFPGDQVVVTGSALLSALLGNEHKARVAEAEEGNGKAAPGLAPIAIAHGTIELPTDRQSLANSPIEGRIARILVEPGQQVAAGDVLAEVNSLQLRSVQLELLQALAQSRLTQQSLERLEGPNSQGVTPKRKVWELQSELESLRLRIEGLKQQLAFLGLDPRAIAGLEQIDLTRSSADRQFIESVPVRAPASGLIAALDVVPGQVVRSQDPLFEIHDLSNVWVKGYVFERDVHRVKLGQTARITFPAYPDLEAAGKVVRIAPMMEEHERVLPVWVEVANPDHLLKDGMLARVTVLAGAPGEEAISGAARLMPKY
ncbi:MAG: efflux RND transporter periplasmic adaptor subunit [Pirellulales bacterium]|nr:efflux RND transporter periplasmic adaptor subunit [Pirellulales bacterium]